MISNSIQVALPQGVLDNQVKDKLYRIRSTEQKIYRDSLIYKTVNTKKDMIFDFKLLKRYDFSYHLRHYLEQFQQLFQ